MGVKEVCCFRVYGAINTRVSLQEVYTDSAQKQESTQELAGKLLVCTHETAWKSHGMDIRH